MQVVELLPSDGREEDPSFGGFAYHRQGRLYHPAACAASFCMAACLGGGRMSIVV
jgi:hypothetical protein